MINLTLRQLRYVEALARHGHFGRAAADCAISQPALSMQIREAEAEIGRPLFERTARHVRPTALGEAVVRQARIVLRGMDDLAALAQAGANDAGLGRLRLGVIPTVAPYLLPRLLTRLREAYPDLDVVVRETLTPRLLDDLQDGRVDAAILAVPVGDARVEAAPLLSEPFVFVRPVAEADRPVPGPAALSAMRLLLLEEGHCFRDQALSFCDLRRATPRETLDASALTTLVQLVAAGMGVTLIPAMAVPVETARAAVSIARFPAPEPTRTLGLVWRRGSPLAEAYRRLAVTLKDLAATAGDGAAVPAAEQPFAQQPVTEQPAAGEPVAERPAATAPSGRKPG